MAVTFADRLRDLLAYLEVSEAEFARQLGMSSSTINRAIRGERSSVEGSPTVILRAAQRLSVAPSYWQSASPPGEFIGKIDDEVSLRRALGPETQAEQIDGVIQTILERESGLVHAAMLVSLAARAPADVVRKFMDYPPPPVEQMDQWMTNARRPRESIRAANPDLVTYWTNAMLDVVTGWLRPHR